jgi:peptidoglycan/xylan/chitin deacetylase (PgdA/CDA1 family)
MPLRVESIPEEQTQPPLRRLYLLYHELRSSKSQYSYVTETGMFERHADLFVCLREAENPGLWPEVTFDDGHISNCELAAPILQSRGLTARFFITAGWTGKKPGTMGWAGLRSLHEAGFSIGAHGWTHKLLTHCSDDELQTELSTSRLTLEDKLGTSIPTMSLPGGRYNHRVLAACAEAGYTQVYTSYPKAESLPLGATVGRLNILGDMQPDWIAKLFQPDGSVLSKLGRQYRIKETAKTLLGDQLYERLWALVNRSEPGAGGGGEGAE